MTQFCADPLLSILIPTKDRYDTLMEVIGEIAKHIDDNRLEIVVCDNSAVPDDQRVKQLIKLDIRISYYHSDDDLPIVDNTEKGIAHCRGRYICFIGDDDLVSPHIMEVVDWLEREGGDCLIYPPARYWWTSVVFAKESRFQKPGVFWLPRECAGTVRRHDSAAELKSVLARGGVAYLNLPRLYHGIVSRHAIERIRSRFGRYVPGSSPDMALSMALALTTTSYLSIDYPVTVFGASRNSGGGLTAARKHYGRIEDQRMLPRDILDNWDNRLPRVWSEQVIYPQTIHEITSRAGLKNELSYSTLYGSLITYEPHIIRPLLPILMKYIAEKPSRIVKLISKILLKGAGRARASARIRTGLGMPFERYVFSNIESVMTFLKELPAPALTNLRSENETGKNDSSQRGQVNVIEAHGAVALGGKRRE